MFSEFFGRRNLDKKIEKNLIGLSLLPSKYYEALYIERRTDISSSLFDLLEDEEREKRGNLVELLKEGKVDTKIEIVKFELFERLIGVTSTMKEVRSLMFENIDRIKEDEYRELVNILKDVSTLCKIMFHMVEGLYRDYVCASNKFDKLKEKSATILNMITNFKFLNEKMTDHYDFEDPKVLISNEILQSIQSIVDVGDKIMEIIDQFSFN
ncbi:MAG: hypothetical protein KGD64_06940 [Candidatus Heimdallarchaeota archaeon]|nr:hypothetical protein [Candidatus Heimdallarchaeota archaeon]